MGFGRITIQTDAMVYAFCFYISGFTLLTILVFCMFYLAAPMSSFIALTCAYFMCVLWVAEIKYVYVYVCAEHILGRIACMSRLRPLAVDE